MLNQEKETDDTTDDEVLFKLNCFEVVKRYQIGQSGKKHDRYVIRKKGAVAILPIMPDGQVILIKQWRAPAQRYIYEIPAGTMEPGEDPATTAGRELIEETGWHAGKIEKMTSFFSSPGIFQEKLHLFRATELTPGKTHQEDGEDIIICPVTKRQAKKMLLNGEIEDAKTILALLTLFIRFDYTASKE